MRLDELNDDERYRVDGYRGIAFRFEGPRLRRDEDWEWSGEEILTGEALMVMVGDDRFHIVDPDDVTPLQLDDFCPECGQIGCTAYPREDDE